MTAALRYRAVVFDLDGTLVDSYAALTEAVNHARRTHELDELTADRIRELVGEGIERLLQRAFERSDVPESVVRAFEERYDEICCSESRILEHVQATLSALSELGVRMAVCTNKPTVFSRKIVEYLGLAPYFDAIVGPDLAGARKPDRRHLLYTLAALGSERDETLFVGDMTVDIETARNAGVAVAALPTGSSSVQQLREAAPDHLLENFSELVRIVRAEAA
jgi:2-phosphoglycolate phosphatase